MNLETKITIYKFTPQLFTLTHFQDYLDKFRYQIDGDKGCDQSLYKPDRLLVSEYQNDASQTMPQNHQP